MARKNYPVKSLIADVNRICKDSDPAAIDMRCGAINVLEHVLHETGNYRGFRYLLEGECSGNPGINHLGGLAHPDYEFRFKNTDSTRVQYFNIE